MISVIIPIYNAEKTISRAIDSILNNTYQDYELLLIDDGSNDRSFEICKKYASSDDRIRLFHQDNQGVSAARNKGIELSNGEYIAFVDSDDYVVEEYLQEFIDAVVKKKADFVCCGFQQISQRKLERRVFDEDVFLVDDLHLFMHSIFKEQADHNWRFFSACMCLYKKSIIDEYNIRFRTDLKYGEDTFFTYQYIHHANSFVYIDKPLYCYVYDNIKQLSEKSGKDITYLIEQFEKWREIYHDYLLYDSMGYYYYQQVRYFLTNYIFVSEHKYRGMKKFKSDINSSDITRRILRRMKIFDKDVSLYESAVRFMIKHRLFYSGYVLGTIYYKAMSLGRIRISD